MRKFRVVVNGNTYEVDIEEIDGASGGESVPTSIPAVRIPRTAAAPKTVSNPAPKPITHETNGTIVAQMPGTIVEIRVKPGDMVKRGQPLVILEAMKMANEVVAPHDGSVMTINVEKDASVNAGDVLVVLN